MNAPIAEPLTPTLGSSQVLSTLPTPAESPNAIFRLTELRNRSLFYALNRRVWELREELDLLDRYVAFKSTSGNECADYHPDSHLPGTFRGGMVARLQQLLTPQADGTITSGLTDSIPRRQTQQE